MRFPHFPHSLQKHCVAVTATCATIFALSGPAAADPVGDSCALLSVLGGNDTAGVDGLVDQISTLWPQENRDTAKQQFGALAGGNSFDGGNLYRLSKLGDDLEDHLVVLRLKTGELSGVWLRYEWTADGLGLVTLDIKRRITDLIPTKNFGTLDPIACE